MLVSTCRAMPSRWNGSLSTARIRSAASSAPPASAHVGEQHGELVAAEPGDGVLGPHRAGQPVGGDLEQPVAGVVAQGVVDLLEPVQVEQAERDGAAGALGLLAGQRPSCSTSRLRLASPVRASCMAACSFSSEIDAVL